MIPETIRIGGYDVKIEYVNNMIPDSAAYGQYIPRMKTIQLDPGVCEQQKHSTFIHELLEAIVEIYELDALKENHHEIVLLGEALYQLLKDNPGVVPSG
ncbi:MAG: hypothetical protein ABR999_10870 [Methanoregula sp.]|jgi:hypothetical protein|uniref:hypothetical protein n=1 Tax=Methanoregula sp. TaxID=2052170 RepID=UPI003D0D236C